MNKQQRKVLVGIGNLLEELESQVDEILEEETEKFENLSEGLQQTIGGEAISEAIEVLESVKASITDACESLLGI